MRLRNIPGADDAISNRSYCITNHDSYKGRWKKDIFKNNFPLHMEIGMGKGRFLMDLAAANPNINYIGIEKYTSVLLRGIQKMEEAPLPNLLFLCINAETITDIFAPSEIDRIYLNFSDPWPKDRHAKRRLTSTTYLDRYDKILTPDGTLEFKTDNTGLFDFSLEQVEESKWHLDAHTFNLHQDPVLNQGNIMTEYEEKFSSLGNPIHKMIISR